ncbi:MAG: outer membrane protein transport protein [Deltaproteobacteria bacterium]|nr:outer membrane protein transport protein [Deltaproteobacteria bacterium]
MGTYFSGPTDGDGAAPFWNPAAMTLTSGTRTDMTLTLGYVRVDYDNPETVGSSKTALVAPQPFAGIVSDLGTENWRFGVSAGVPYVVGARWDSNAPEAQVTRYFANDAYLVHAVATPAIAYQLSEVFRVGAGVNVTYSKLSADFDKDFATVLNSSVGSDFGSGPFDAGDPNLAAPVELRSAGVGFGAVFGASLELGPAHLGAAVHTPIETQASGTVVASYPDEMLQFVNTAAPTASLPPLAGNVDMTLTVPLAVFTAARFDLSPHWDLGFDYRLVDRSSHTSVGVLISDSTTEHLNDTSVVKGTRDRHSFGLRIRHRFSSGRGSAVLRGRYENNSITELNTTPNNVDFDKLELGAGLRWRLSQRTELTAVYTHFHVFDSQIDASLHRPTTEPSLAPYNHPSPIGRYSAAADKLSLSLGVSF